MPAQYRVSDSWRRRGRRRSPVSALRRRRSVFATSSGLPRGASGPSLWPLAPAFQFGAGRGRPLAPVLFGLRPSRAAGVLASPPSKSPTLEPPHPSSRVPGPFPSPLTPRGSPGSFGSHAVLGPGGHRGLLYTKFKLARLPSRGACPVASGVLRPSPALLPRASARRLPTPYLPSPSAPALAEALEPLPRGSRRASGRLWRARQRARPRQGSGSADLLGFVAGSSGPSCSPGVAAQLQALLAGWRGFAAAAVRGLRTQREGTGESAQQLVDPPDLHRDPLEARGPPRKEGPGRPPCVGSRSVARTEWTVDRVRPRRDVTRDRCELSDDRRPGTGRPGGGKRGRGPPGIHACPRSWERNLFELGRRGLR